MNCNAKGRLNHKSRVVEALFVLAIIQFVTASVCSSSELQLKVYDSLASAGKVQAARPVILGIEVVIDAGDTVYGISNCFSVSSSDGAIWYPHVFLDTIIEASSRWVDSIFYTTWSDSLDWQQFFDVTLVSTLSDHDGDPLTPHQFGQGSDSVCFGGSRSSAGSGLVGPMTFTIWPLVIDSISSESSGKTLCVDSGQFSNYYFGEWFWVLKDNSIVHPIWGGGKCFEIISCCQGERGNINFDLQDTIDISDLTALVGWMFKSGNAPPCMLEADVDGNSDHDIADVTALVGYMFKGGSAPAGCP